LVRKWVGLTMLTNLVNLDTRNGSFEAFESRFFDATCIPVAASRSGLAYPAVKVSTVCAFRLYVHEMMIDALDKDFASKMPRSRLLKA